MFWKRRRAGSGTAPAGDATTGRAAGPTRAAIGAALLGALLSASPFAGAAPGGVDPEDVASGLAALMGQIGDRVRDYYDKVTSVLCTETVSQQQLRYNLKPQGRPRETVYDLMVVREPARDEQSESSIQIERKLRTVNGRPVKKNEPPGCSDPKSITAEPLSFLLPRYQPFYRFTASRDAGDGPPGAIVIDYEQIHRDPVQVTWDGLCFDARGGGVAGRIWLDASTREVTQLDMRLIDSFRIPPPPGLMYEILPIRVERSEVRIRFARVDFQDPPETLLLPESMTTLTVFRGVPSLRTVQTFSGFRRFLAEAKVKGAL
jgi:hypothetical protein